MGDEDLIVRLKAGLDADEQLAGAATQSGWQFTETADEGPDRAVVFIDHPTVPDAATVLFEADWGTPADASHVARHDPARVLREVAAKRAILADHAPYDIPGYPVTVCFRCADRMPWPCNTVRALAVVDGGQ